MTTATYKLLVGQLPYGIWYIQVARWGRHKSQHIPSHPVANSLFVPRRITVGIADREHPMSFVVLEMLQSSHNDSTFFKVGQVFAPAHLYCIQHIAMRTDCSLTI